MIECTYEVEEQVTNAGSLVTVLIRRWTFFGVQIWESVERL